MHHETQQKHHEGDVAGAAKRAQGRMEETGEEIRGHLEHIARDGRTRIATELRTVGEAANAAAERLSDEEHERIGSYVRGIRKQAERAADYVEQHDVRSVAADLNHLARRNPALFVGGAAVLGLVAGRFLSARPPREGYGADGGYGSSGYGGGYGGYDEDSEPWVRRERGATYDPDQRPDTSARQPGVTTARPGGYTGPGATGQTTSGQTPGQTTPGQTPGQTTAQPPIGRGSGEADGRSKFDQ